METNNADRFKGFADIYDKARPKMPLYPIEIIKKYLGREPEHVVDLGCGTGLSTAIWKGHCGDAMGVEPSDDMLSEALKKQGDGVTFKKAFSHETGLPDGFADAVVCSQSFHWMEPKSTLAEVNRILKCGGVFATVDCDWPPVCGWEAEAAFEELFGEICGIEERYPELGDKFEKWDKEGHLENIKQSGYFRYAREIVFSNSEAGDAKRFADLALSQGGLQSILKFNAGLIDKKLEKFSETVRKALGGECFDMDFCYRIRVGVK